VYAIDGTRVSVAILLSFEGRARTAAVHRRSVDDAGALSHTTSAIFVARGPFGPFRNVAVDRTVLSFADAALGQDATSDTAILHVDDDGTSLGLGTSTAGLSANTPPLRELREHTVLGASLGVANTLLGKGAFVTTVSSLLDGVELSHLGAFTASLGACAPGKPSVFTVNRTRVDIASSLVRQVGASGTVVRGVDDDLAETLLDATTALFGTWLEVPPSRHFAVDRLGGGCVSGSHGGLVGLHTDGAGVPVSGKVEADSRLVLVVAQAVHFSTGNLVSEIGTVLVEGNKFGLDFLGISLVHGPKIHADSYTALLVVFDEVALGPLQHVLFDRELFSKKFAKSVLLVPVERFLRALLRGESDRHSDAVVVFGLDLVHGAALGNFVAIHIRASVLDAKSTRLESRADAGQLGAGADAVGPGSVLFARKTSGAVAFVNLSGSFSFTMASVGTCDLAKEISDTAPV
jgi:hypothetical protein